MADNIETEIRKALDAKAHEIDVPDTLAVRTVELARESGPSSLGDRIRAWRDGRRSRARVTGYPRILYVAGAGATAVLLFVIGSFVVQPTGGSTDTDAAGPAVMHGEQDTSTALSADGNAGAVVDAPMQAAVPAPAQRSAATTGGDATAGSAGSEVAPDAAKKIAADSGNTTAEIAPVPPVPGPVTGKFPPQIVRTANVEVQVKSFEPAWSRANAIAARYAGYVTNSNTELIKDRLGRGSLVMRVPVTKLDAALADLRKLGTLTNLSTSADDISAPIADVKARIKTLETQELQLLDLMRRANSLSETLEVRSQLDGVRQEIESYKAQRDVYENQVAYSTINATIFEKGVDPNEGPKDGILSEALDRSVRIGLTIVAGTLAVLGGLIPLAVLAFAVWFVARAVRRRRSTA